jgi:hypothetical protein
VIFSQRHLVTLLRGTRIPVDTQFIFTVSLSHMQEGILILSLSISSSACIHSSFMFPSSFPGSNPSTARYNASLVKITTLMEARIKEKLFILLKML